MKKIDISIAALEKGIDIAKGFIEKLIYPSAEELGLLFKDGVAKWRFNNQIQTLIKTQALCEKHNINPKTISTKLLYPLLEYASLEENEKLQDKWATLLANMVDSNQNIENHVFPYLLSQLSVQEFDVLENTFKKKGNRIKKFTRELEDYLASYEQIQNDLASKILNCEAEIDKYRLNNLNNPQNYQDTYNIYNQIDELKSRKNQHKIKQSRIEKKINESELIPSEELKNFEVSNLIRLGIVKEVVHSYGYIDSEIITVNKGDGYSKYSEDYIELADVTVNIERDVIENELTELGDLFMRACQEKGEVNE